MFLYSSLDVDYRYLINSDGTYIFDYFWYLDTVERLFQVLIDDLNRS